MTPEEAAAVLGVPQEATPSEIDRAYRRLARDLHPDRFAGRPADEIRAANERFVVVMRAHETLLAVSRLRAPRGHAPETAHAMPAEPAEPGPAFPERGPSTPSGPARSAPAPSMPAPPPAAFGSVVPRFSWPLFLSWALLMTIGAALSFSSGPVYTWVDWWPRLVLLVGFALATALTRRRWVWVTTLVLLGLSAIAVVIDTTIVGLLGLGGMLIASLGLAVQSGLVRLPPPP
ncbi:DnaJ family molecular chaperone [Agromyces sp. Marseille-P2726]|uniref:J domain-containing protein n=1 Tax=Agromyces sp. Marseille-P2726 TaxID=2709132 RepID=UPI0020C416B3|nr:J domain-containing protein [Agromyces sp. Marseille-P2726]